LIDLRRVRYRRRVVDYAKEGHEVIKDHLAAVAKGLAEGIKFGWPTVDKSSAGMQPGDFISFIGRPGEGKTYMLLYLMLHAWRQGKVPMFVSMEMNPQLIIQRLAALDTHTSAKQIKLGNLSSKMKNPMMATLIENKKMPPMWVLDGGLSATVDDILMHALEKNPDVIFIDGAYLLRVKGTSNRWERLSDNAERIKRDVCEGLKLPVVCSYQFNRDAIKKKKSFDEVGLENIAGADVIGQVSSLVFGMFDEESVETMERRRINILKGRYGERGSFKVNWIFDVVPFMDFSEIKEESLSDLDHI